MSDTSKKRSRKSKLVPRDCGEDEENKKIRMEELTKTLMTELETEDRQLDSLPHPLQTVLPKLRTQLNKTHDIADTSANDLRFFVNIEVVECDDLNEIINLENDDSDVEMHQIDEESKSRERKWPIVVTDDEYRSIVTEKFSKNTRALADKVLEIHIRNYLGRYVNENVDEMDYFRKYIQYMFSHVRNWQKLSKLRESVLSYKCYVCDIGWWHLGPFQEHIREHGEEIRISFQTCWQEGSIVAHFGNLSGVKEIPIEGRCWQCMKTWDEHANLKRNSQPYYSCAACIFKTAVCSALLEHEGCCVRYQNDHIKETINYEIKSKCSICLINCITEERLKAHMTLCHFVRSDFICHQPNMRKCLQCGLNYMFHTMHTCRFRPLHTLCNYCMKRFPGKFLADMHMAHTRKNVHCGVCNMYLRSQCMMAEHMARHSKTYVLLYKCVNCPDHYLFNEEKIMKDHRKMHPDKKYSKNSGFEMMAVPRKYFNLPYNEDEMIGPGKPHILGPKLAPVPKKPPSGIEKAIAETQSAVDAISYSQIDAHGHDYLLHPYGSGSEPQNISAPKDDTQHQETNDTIAAIQSISDVVIKTETHDYGYYDQTETDIVYEDIDIKEEAFLDTLSNAFVTAEDVTDSIDDQRISDVLKVSTQIVTIIKEETKVNELLNDIPVETEEIVNEAEDIVSGAEEVVNEVELVVNEAPRIVNETEELVNETEDVFNATEQVNTKEQVVNETEQANATEQVVNKTEKQEINNEVLSDEDDFEDDIIVLNNENSTDCNDIVDDADNRNGDNEDVTIISQACEIIDISDTEMQENDDDSNAISNENHGTSREIHSNATSSKNRETSSNESNETYSNATSSKIRETSSNESNETFSNAASSKNRETSSDESNETYSNATSSKNRETSSNESNETSSSEDDETTKTVSVKQERAKNRLYNCPRCDFKAKHREFQNHVKRHCPRPKSWFNVQLHSWTSFSCTKCDCTFRTFKSYVFHFREHKVPPKTCPECFQVFSIDYKLLYHMKSHIKSMFTQIHIILEKDKFITSKQDKVYQCKKCIDMVKYRNFFKHWEQHLKLEMNPGLRVKCKIEKTENVETVELPTRELSLDMLNTNLELGVKCKMNKTEDVEAEELPTSELSLNMLNNLLCLTSEPACPGAKKSIPCLFCDRMLSRAAYLSSHYMGHVLEDAKLKREHCDAKTLACQICDQQFETNFSYKQHMRTHTIAPPVYRCDLCPDTFDDSANFAEHKKIHNIPALICDVCGSEFVKKSSLIKHIKIHELKKPIKIETDPKNSHRFTNKEINDLCNPLSSCLCTKCDHTYANFRTYVLHFSEAHNIPAKTCPECIQTFTQRSQLLHHMVSHVKRTFKGINIIVKKDSFITSRRDKVYQCKKCAKVVKAKKFFKHWEGHLKLEKKPEVRVECKIERYEDVEESDLAEMELSADMLKQLLELVCAPITRSEGKSEYSCVLCERPFSRAPYIKRHYIEHLLRDALCKRVRFGTDTIACQLCGDQFSANMTYKQHMRNHASMAVYICELCARSFSDSSNFAKHKKVHNMAAAACDVCGAKFFRKESLVKHLEIHEQIEPMKCPLCPKIFHMPSRYRKHVRAGHLEKGSSQFTCNVCLMRFPNTKGRLDHMWAAHKVRKKKVDCPICDRSFRKFTDMTYHLRLMHNAKLKHTSSDFFNLSEDEKRNSWVHFQEKRRVPEVSSKAKSEELVVYATGSEDQPSTVAPQIKAVSPNKATAVIGNKRKWSSTNNCSES